MAQIVGTRFINGKIVTETVFTSDEVTETKPKVETKETKPKAETKETKPKAETKQPKTAKK